MNKKLKNIQKREVKELENKEYLGKEVSKYIKENNQVNSLNTRRVDSKNKQKTLKIGIDIDEVVTEYVIELLDYLEKTKNKKVNYEEIDDYYFVKPFNMHIEEIGELIKEHSTEEVVYNLTLVDKAKESIDYLGKNYNVYFITSRPLKIKKATHDFFKKHFPEHNFDIIFSGDAWENGNKSKAEICEELEIDIFIEDNADYVLNCAKKGINCLLLDKPWNKKYVECDKNKNICRVYNWNEILNKIEEIENKTFFENSFNIIEEIKKFVKECFDSPEAKYKESYENHFIPLVGYAERLVNEFGGDKEIVLLASWLHDIGSIIYGRENHHITGAEIAEKKLKELGYPKEKTELVKKCILNHRGSIKSERNTIEERIIAEADAISNFDNIPGIFKAAFIYENLDQGKAKEIVKIKLKRKYNQLSEESKKLIKSKYEAAMLLFE